MTSLPPAQPPVWPLLAWLTVGLAGIAAPALALVLLADPSACAPLASLAGPVLAVGLMGAGMIAAAVVGRFWIGVVLALIAGAVVVLWANWFFVLPA